MELKPDIQAGVLLETLQEYVWSSFFVQIFSRLLLEKNTRKEHPKRKDMSKIQYAPRMKSKVGFECLAVYVYSLSYTCHTCTDA